MFSIETYIMKCEKNRIDKTNFISNVNDLGEDSPILLGTLKENCDILNPVILVELDIKTDEYVPKFNYCYIEIFARWYFVENVVVVNKNLFELYLKVDVLYTYKNYLLEQSAYISRNENEYNVYLVDNDLISNTNTRIEIDTLNLSLFDTYTDDNTILRYILTTTNTKIVNRE